KTVDRRPHLTLEWESPTERESVKKFVRLEYGRSSTVLRLKMKPMDWISVDFESTDGFLPPLVEVRGGKEKEVSPWEKIIMPVRREWNWLEVRVTAGRTPVNLGESFAAETLDTWVRTAPPEKQIVPWVFISPSGVIHEARAEYQGNYRWTIRFTPD